VQNNAFQISRDAFLYACIVVVQPQQEADPGMAEDSPELQVPHLEVDSSPVEVLELVDSPVLVDTGLVVGVLVDTDRVVEVLVDTGLVVDIQHLGAGDTRQAGIHMDPEGSQPGGILPGDTLLVGNQLAGNLGSLAGAALAVVASVPVELAHTRSSSFAVPVWPEPERPVSAVCRRRVKRLQLRPPSRPPDLGALLYASSLDINLLVFSTLFLFSIIG
jgi:hypothetical protein